MIFGNSMEDQPQNSYRITILTNEYVIEGSNDPNYHAFEGAYDSRVDSPLAGSLDLENARVQSMGNVNIPARTFSLWRMPSLLNVVAIFSDDPAAEDDLLNIWEEFQTPFKAVLYVGDYIIEGTIYSDDDSPPEFGVHVFTPIENMTITHRDNKVDVIHARWGIVNSAIMYGYSEE